MVALMVSFLVGMQGFQMVCGPGQRDSPYGDSKYGKITYRDVATAQSDMDVLSRFLRLDLRSIEFDQLRRNDQKAPLAYAMLLQESRAVGGNVTDGEIDEYLATIGLGVDSASYRSVLSRVNRQDSGATSISLRATLGRWVRVLRRYRAGQVTSPPSDAELRKLFRDLNETLTFRVLEVPAKKFTASVREPTEQEVLQHFNLYRRTRAGSYGRTAEAPQGSAESFGIGYYQPVRASVAYLVIHRGVIARVVRPGDRAVRKYFRKNPGEFTREVPKNPAASQPATAPTTQPTTRPDVEMKTVPMNVDEAWDQIVAKLSDRAAEARIEEFLQQVQTTVDAKLDAGSADIKIYQKVYDSMIDSPRAGDLLGKVVSAANIEALRGKPLDKAIGALANAAGAGLAAICYPWDTEGEFTVSKDIRIPQTLRADGPRTVDAILDEITRLVFTTAKESLEAIPAEKDKDKDKKTPQYPKLKWTTCAGFDGVLFPVSGSSGMTLLPMKVGRTPMSDAKALGENEDIGEARISPRGQSLAAAALKAQPFMPGQVMFVQSDSGLNRVLWQVVKSRAAHEPETLDAELRKKVIDDWKLLEAFRAQASQAAKDIAKKAATVGLEAAAKSADMETTVVGPVARKVRFSMAEMIRRQLMQQAIQQLFMRGGLPQGLTEQEFMRQVSGQAERAAMSYRPVDYMPSSVGKLDLKVAAASQLFLGRVFYNMVPKNIEEPVTADPTAPVVTIAIPPAGAHFVAQRTAYAPAVISDFERTERAQLAREAQAIIQWRARNVFFGYDSIVKRVNYTDPFPGRSGR